MNKFSWGRAIAVYYIICGIFGLIFMIKALEKETPAPGFQAPNCTRSELARPEIPRCEIIRTHKI